MEFLELSSTAAEKLYVKCTSTTHYVNQLDELDLLLLNRLNKPQSRPIFCVKNWLAGRTLFQYEKYFSHTS